MRPCVLILTLACSLNVLASEAEPLELQVSPRTCIDPCTIRVTVRTEPHSRNRAFVLELDSWAYSRSSVITLDGSDAALIYERLFESLPAGTYEVRVMLVRSPEQRIHRRDVVRVAGTTTP
jgi:hypothetical protein